MMMMYRIRGAILLGILLVSIISWPRSTAVTYFPHTASGDALFDYFKNVVTFHKLKHVGNVIDVRLLTMSFGNVLIMYFYSTIMGMCGSSSLRRHFAEIVVLGSNGKVWYALVTFLYVDILGMSQRVCRVPRTNIIQQIPLGKSTAYLGKDFR